MQVSLTSPASRAINHYRPPLALMYLSGYLKQNGIDTKIIDVIIPNQIRDKKFIQQEEKYIENVENKIIKEVMSIDTDIVGITCYTPELDEVERLARRIKSIKKEVKIVVGGTHPTFYPDDFIKEDSFFDFAVIGEGELTFLELVKAIRSENKEYAKVAGITFFDNDQKKIVTTGTRCLEESLDSISFPDYDDIDMEFYTTASPYAIRGVFTRSFYILSSRGCPSSCTFCVAKKLRDYHGIKKFVRLRSPESLIEEIKHLREKYNIDSFYFIDDLFALKKENVYKFCELMKENKLPLVWGCSSKVNTVNYEVLEAMRDAGCVQIDFGVEKGSDEALKILKKGITVARIRKTFSHCRDLGIRTFANMLINTQGEMEKDLDDIVSLVQEIKPNIVSFNIFAPYPGCEIYDLRCQNLSREDYPRLMNAALFLDTMPEKFRFASHDVDLLKWATVANRKYNKIFPNLRIFYDLRYVKSVLFSKRKDNYVKHLINLTREFINQKF